MVTQIMTQSIRVTTKKKRGRPATTGRGTQVGERWHDAELAAIDAWIATSSDKTISRAHAIRRLVALGLKVGATKPKQAPGARADRAKELASKAIDKMGDPTAHPDERDQRRRRLTKGPEEFREVRVDRPKAKGK
jgi:hypothetical protein